MSTETMNVDVLAVMDRVAEFGVSAPEWRNMPEARAAVAELIEAAKAMEQDLAELDRMQIRVPTATRQRAYALRNALARVGDAART